MDIRLQGTHEECLLATELLAELYDVMHVSRLYVDRPPSPLCRRYLTTAPATEEK